MTRRGAIFVEEPCFASASFPCQNVFKKCTTKTEVLMEKGIQKNYTLNCSHKCSCTFPHSYALLRHLVFEKNHFM